jgi:hypothetical protein
MPAIVRRHVQYRLIPLSPLFDHLVGTPQQ